MNEGHMSLWSEVFSTDPEYTKSYQGAGGFKGTAISSLYPIQRATQMFGPLGQGWGYEILADEFIPGAPILNETHGVIGNEQTHSLRIRVWANWKGSTIATIHYGLTPHIYSNKYGVQTDHEAQKKSLTDALKKALTMWGFSADVYMGLHDDPDYLRSISNEYAVAKSDDQAGAMVKQAIEYNDWTIKTANLLKTAVSLNELQGLYVGAMRRAKREADEVNQKAFTIAKDRRKSELSNSQPEEKS